MPTPTYTWKVTSDGSRRQSETEYGHRAPGVYGTIYKTDCRASERTVTLESVGPVTHDVYTQLLYLLNQPRDVGGFTTLVDNIGTGYTGCVIDVRASQTEFFGTIYFKITVTLDSVVG